MECAADCGLVADLVRAAGVGAADWLVAGIHGFAESVLSLVPSGFAAYARVFHPGYRNVGEDEVRPVPWAEIAAATGARMHAGAQLEAINRGEYPSAPQPGIYDHGPTIGSLPKELARSVAQVLGAHTGTPESCWFAVWDGYGAARGSEVAEAPRFHLPNRDYHLLHGPVDALGRGMFEGLIWQSPNLCWPDDHAWCLASEIDHYSSYIGCEHTCLDALLEHGEIEALPIDQSTGISFDSDALN